MYFGISNCYSVNNLKFKGKKILLISCLSESEYLNLGLEIPTFNECVTILKLNITDTKDFDLKNAELLNKFIIDNDFDEVITYCALGLSRSPAIMICIAKILGNIMMEEIIKENYKFYNKDIVEEFEKYPYKTKNLEANDCIWRDADKKSGSIKTLVKESDFMVE